VPETLDSLRADRDRLAGILEGLGDGLLALDADGRVLLVNEAARAMLGLAGDVPGRALTDVVDSVALHDAIFELKRGSQSDTREIEIAGPELRRFLLRVSPLPGDERGSVFMFHDVTDLRQLETVRRDFVANVSHELRTPVTAIRGATETLLSGAIADPTATARFVEIIDRNSRRLVRLVEDLLDLSRIESRQLELGLEPLDVREVAVHAVGLIERAAEDRGVRLVVDFSRDLPRAKANRRALEQVLSNLLDNGVKYAGPGATVTVYGEVKGDHIRIRVDDTGPGIEKQHLPRLFERFYRVDAGRSREMGGTGLGLAIVKHLVESMRGRIAVKSAPGRGASFRFTLPQEAR